MQIPINVVRAFLLILDTYILPEAWEKGFSNFIKPVVINYMNYLYTVWKYHKDEDLSE